MDTTGTASEKGIEMVTRWELVLTDRNGVEVVLGEATTAQEAADLLMDFARREGSTTGLWIRPVDEEV